MIAKLAAAAAMSILVPAPVAPASLPMVVIQPASIVQVICLKMPWIIAGTAFRVGSYLISADHVTSAGACTINGKPIHVIYHSKDSDYSILSADDGPFIPIDCGGFQKDRKYLAIGYARGLPSLTTVELTGSGASDGGWSILTGLWTVIPGQSGGPIIDENTGKVVGIVNVENFEQGWSGSRPLKDLPICKGNIA